MFRSWPAALAANARRFEDIAELDFRRPDKDPDEIDVAAFADGRVIIGEAKCVATLGTRREASRCITKEAPGRLSCSAHARTMARSTRVAGRATGQRLQ